MPPSLLRCKAAFHSPVTPAPPISPGSVFLVLNTHSTSPASMQVYVAYTEGVNFKKSLAELLGLEAGAGIGACLQRIRQLLDRSAASLEDHW